jgi:hypothetical protein
MLVIPSYPTDPSTAEPARDDSFQEERLRYARDAVEKNYERRLRVIDGLNGALLAVFGIVFALIALFVDKMCDYGWIPMAACFLVAAVALGALLKDAKDIDADEFIADMTDNPAGTLADSIGAILDRIRAAREIVTWKQYGLRAIAVFVALLTFYVFLVKVDVLRPFHVPSEVCQVPDQALRIRALLTRIKRRSKHNEITI